VGGSAATAGGGGGFGTADNRAGSVGYTGELVDTSRFTNDRDGGPIPPPRTLACLPGLNPNNWDRGLFSVITPNLLSGDNVNDSAVTLKILDPSFGFGGLERFNNLFKRRCFIEIPGRCDRDRDDITYTPLYGTSVLTTMGTVKTVRSNTFEKSSGSFSDGKRKTLISSVCGKHGERQGLTFLS